MLITIYAEYNFFYNFQHLNQLHKLKFTMQKYSTKNIAKPHGDRMVLI